MAKHNHSGCETCKPLRASNSPLAGPTLGRRTFFKLAGAGVTGYFLTPLAKALPVQSQSYAHLTSTAKYCIFILLTGAPSHVDTFDLKVGAWTPADFNPTPFNGINFPQGLMPNIATQLDKIAIVRSVRSTALVHQLLQAGMTALLLWVLAENPARQFYERLGGQPVYDKTVIIGGVPLIEVAYGWPDARRLLAPPGV